MKKDVNVFNTYLVDLDAILELTSHRTPDMSVRHAGHLQTFSEKGMYIAQTNKKDENIIFRVIHSVKKKKNKRNYRPASYDPHSWVRSLYFLASSWAHLLLP